MALLLQSSVVFISINNNTAHVEIHVVNFTKSPRLREFFFLTINPFWRVSKIKKKIKKACIQ